MERSCWKFMASMAFEKFQLMARRVFDIHLLRLQSGGRRLGGNEMPTKCLKTIFQIVDALNIERHMLAGAARGRACSRAKAQQLLAHGKLKQLALVWHGQFLCAQNGAVKKAQVFGGLGRKLQLDMVNRGDAHAGKILFSTKKWRALKWEA